MEWSRLANQSSRKMGIRRVNKDHLKQLAPALIGAIAPALQTEPDSPLRFWTKHPTDPCLVILSPLELGEGKQAHSSSPRARAFSGRPQLILQLAPAVRLLVEYGSRNSVVQYIHSLRTWWRLFDDVESAFRDSGALFAPVSDVRHITEIHRQRAFDTGLDRLQFGNFIRIINLVRKSEQLPQLYWSTPESPNPTRHLPPKWQTDKIRLALKHEWFATLDRWERTQQLLAGDSTRNVYEEHQLRSYRRFAETVVAVRHPKPDAAALCGDQPYKKFNEEGYSVPEMLRGFYPDGNDIRAAFHYCLANTGWNPAVLLALNVDEPFLEPHPKDNSRYILRGYKARGKSEQIVEGLLKSQGSAGHILKTLMARTAPLREQLRLDLANARAALEALRHQGASTEAIDSKRKDVASMSAGVRSPWLYAESGRGGATWLDKGSYARGSSRSTSDTFLSDVVREINIKQAVDRQVSVIKAGDFRDAFAAYAYQVSGGMILYVMKVLGHKSPATSQLYLDNTLLNQTSHRLYATFSNALWQEIKIYKRADPTILAKWCRDGSVTEDERKRLLDYRALRRSRIGMGCKDPTNPPRRIAANFEYDGKSMCPVQRCTLCVENGVIFPDSVDGLCKRLAELRHIQSRIPTLTFVGSSFDEEMANTELALKCFDEIEVVTRLAEWERRILLGEHRVIEFDGVARIES